MVEIRPPVEQPRRSLASRLRFVRLIGWASVVAFAVFECLNFTNFCYRDLRFYSNTDLVSAAVKLNMARFEPKGERNKKYDSTNDFILQSHNCCEVIYNNFMVNVTAFARLLAINEVAVNVYYKMSDNNDKYKYYDATVKMNSCGGILTTMGTPEEHGPFRRTP